MRQMTAAQVASLLNSAETKPTLIDVREQHELVNGMIEGAMHIPMNTVPEKVNELEQYKSNTVILICRSGKRSHQVGLYLEQLGFSDIINLSGGINAWASDVDTTMIVY